MDYISAHDIYHLYIVLFHFLSKGRNINDKEGALAKAGIKNSTVTCVGKKIQQSVCQEKKLYTKSLPEPPPPRSLMVRP